MIGTYVHKKKQHLLFIFTDWKRKKNIASTKVFVIDSYMRYLKNDYMRQLKC